MADTWTVTITWTERPIIGQGPNGPIRYPIPAEYALPPIVCTDPNAADLHAREARQRWPNRHVEIHHHRSR